MHAWLGMLYKYTATGSARAASADNTINFRVGKGSTVLTSKGGLLKTTVKQLHIQSTADAFKYLTVGYLISEVETTQIELHKGEIHVRIAP